MFDIGGIDAQQDDVEHVVVGRRRATRSELLPIDLVLSDKHGLSLERNVLRQFACDRSVESVAVRTCPIIFQRRLLCNVSSHIEKIHPIRRERF